MSLPWYTSNDLIEAVKRKISFPVSQNTFTEDDILAFANEEMSISQVPSVLMYHEEYFVVTETVPLESNKSRYSIPSRAIGMKLRDVFYQDEQGNVFEMTRVHSDDRAYFQAVTAINNAIAKFYIQGNDVVLTPAVNSGPSGSLLFVYYLRPNQLVLNDRAATIESFSNTITIDLTALVAGDTVTIDDVVFTAVSGSPSTNEFQIAGTSTLTATNLKNAINTNGVVAADNGTPSTNIVTLTYSDRQLVISTTNSTSFSIPATLIVNCDQIPAHFANGNNIDFLQTKPGHKTLALSIAIPNNGISGNSIIFNSEDVPEDVIVNDYICSEYECIIPQIPSDLHTGLAERTAARILSSIGDQAGLNNINTKIGEIDQRQSSILDNRVEGAPQKVLNRRSFLRFGKFYNRRGW